MKRLFRKDRPVAKLIALWVAFIMMMTPLLENAGFKNPTKAASMLLVQTGITNSAYNETVDIPGGVAVDEETGTFSVDVTGRTPAEINVSSFASNITFDIKVNELVCSNPDTYIVKEAEVCYVSATQDPGDTIPAVDSSISTGNTIDVSTNKNVYVYLKAVKVTDENGSSETIYTASEYIKLATITVTTLDSTSFGNAAWKNGDDVVSTYASAATISSGFECIDTVKYMTTNSQTLPTDDQWASASTASVTVNENGKTYYGYIGVFDDNATTPGYVYRLDAIKIDNVFPAINNNQGAKIYSTNYMKQYANIGPQKVGAFTATYSEVVYLDSNVDAVVFATYVTEDNLADGSVELGFYPNGSDNPDKTYNSSGYNPMGTTGGYYTTTVTVGDLSENTIYQVKAKVKDKAGNESNLLFATVYFIDKTFKAGPADITPEGGNSIGTTFATGDDATISSTAHTITIPVSSGNELVKAVVSYEDKNGNEQSETVDLSNAEATNTIYSTNLTYTFDEEGVYNNIQVVFTDKEKSLAPISCGNFTLDKNAPDARNGSIYTFATDSGDTTGVVLGEENLDAQNNVYILDSTLANSYRFEFFAMDSMSGIDTAQYYINDVNTKTDLAVGDKVGDYTKYSVTLSREDIKTLLGTDKDYLEITSVFTDKAGLTKEEKSVKFTLSSSEIEINSALLKTADGATVDIQSEDDTNRYSDSVFKVTVTVSSGYKISEIKIADTDTTNDFSETVQVNDNENTDGYNDVAKRYTVTKTITIPGDVDVNTLLTNAQVTVKDVNNQTTAVSLGKLLYDNTNPVILNADNMLAGSENEESYGKFVVDNEWYNADDAKTVNAIITPGPQDVEADLVSASYTVSNSSDGNGTMPVTVDDTNKAKVEITGVLVPESKSDAGTTITFSAKDKAGNTQDERNNKVTIKVDATIPEVKTVKINEKTDNLVNLGPNITVKSSFQDNLTFDTYTVKLINPTTGAVVKEDTQTLGSTTTSEKNPYVNYKTGEASVSFNGLADGTYTVQVIVTDKAGNESKKAEKQITIGSALTVTTNIYKYGDSGKESIGSVFSTEERPVVISSKQHEVEVNITSGYKPTKIDIFDGTGTTPIYSEPIDVNKGWGQELYQYTKTITLPADGKDVAYKNLRVVVYDNKPVATATPNSKEVQLGAFTYDTKAPNMEFKGLYKQNSDGAWAQITGDDCSYGAYIVNATKKETYRFVYDVVEETSGFEEGSVKLISGDKNIGDMLLAIGDEKILTDAKGYEYYAEFSTEQLISTINTYGQDSGDSNKRLSVQAKATDLALNESSVSYAWPPVQAQDTELKVSAVLYKDYDSETKTGTVISINGTGDTFTNEAYTLVVEASSPYKLADYTLTHGYGDEVEIITSEAVTAEENAAGFDVLTQRYTVVKEITIPAAALDGEAIDNQVLNNIILTVADEGSENAYEESLGDLVYDATLPYLEATSYENGLLVDDETWYSKFILQGEIHPGKQTVETSIDNATLTVTGSKDGEVVVNSDEQNSVFVAVGDEESNQSYMGFRYPVPESKEVTGTKVVFEAYDEAGNYLPDNKTGVIRVDGTVPKVDFTINDLAQPEVPIIPNIELDIHATDNLTLSKITVDVKQLDGDKKVSDGFTYDSGKALKKMDAEELVIDETYALELSDGLYEVTIVAYDKADNASEPAVKTFEVDNTIPENTLKIVSGDNAGKQPSKNFDGTDRDYYYSDVVTLEFTYTEKNLKNVTITDGTSPVNVTFRQVGDTDQYIGSYPISGSGKHEVTIITEDLTGHTSEPMTTSFIIDGDAPTVQSLINGGISYTENMGMLMLTSNATVAYTVSDGNEDADDFNIQIIKKEPDSAAVVGAYLPTTNRSFPFSEEAEYTVNAYAIDMAGNQGVTDTVNFRVDTTAPVLTIGGIGDGGNSSTAVTVSFNMQEKFWQDASGTVEIYRKAADGYGESLMETIDYDPTSANSSIARTLSDNGVYRIEFNASDRVGHTATLSQTFTIDKDAPQVSLVGVNNYDVTDQSVEINAEINDDFYASKTVTVTGTRTDIDGKVNTLTIDNFNAASNPTVINEIFTEDGIYDITITATDSVGNSHSTSVHFTIDKTKPVIGDLSDIDGKVLTSFAWDKDLDELVSDLTVCDVHMYLNGQEYNGEDAVEDGSYVLLITAEDELGHMVEKSVEFVLDTKGPVFIVTGVEDEEKRLEEPYHITVTLQLEEDTLTTVTLNGKVIAVTNDTATIDVTEVGEYKLYMEAVDEAGNTASAEYEFELEAEAEFNIWLIIAIAAVLLLIIFFIIWKNRKKDKEQN